MARVTYKQKNWDVVGDPFADVTYPKPNQETIDYYENGQTLLIYKPLHATSFDIIKHLRRILKIKKIGHAGTLDPLATGLVIVCTGKNTKKINEYMGLSKVYHGKITLGATTASFDLETLPENFKPFNHITQKIIDNIKEKFKGEIKQIPPKYSALKKDGVALYDLARKGIDITILPRIVTIYELELKIETLPIISFTVKCSTGTYIRSLAYDIGDALGTGAYLSELHRDMVGEMNSNNAKTLKEIAESVF